jgi:deoxycytidylate deaminase
VTPGATLYSTKLPCLWCSKLLVQGKLGKIVCLKPKHDLLEYENVLLVKEMLKKGNI